LAIISLGELVTLLNKPLSKLFLPYNFGSKGSTNLVHTSLEAPFYCAAFDVKNNFEVVNHSYTFIQRTYEAQKVLLI